MECSAIPAKVIATCFALVAFAAALAIGYAVDNPTVTILYRALVTMLLCWPVGYAVGAVAQRVNEKAITDYKARHPMTVEEPPDSPSSSSSTSTSASEAAGAAPASSPSPERNSPSSPAA
jgi:hypothetical protein